jgi:hypothetical protein
MNAAPADAALLDTSSLQAPAIVVADDRKMTEVRLVQCAVHIAAREGPKRKSRHARIRFRQGGLFFSMSLRAYWMNQRPNF